MRILKPLLIIALVFLAYSGMLASPFKTLDDRYSIVSNPLIQDAAHWPRLFVQGYFNDRSYYRPLVNLSFMAEYQLFGPQPFFYNLNNLLLHAINALLVWALASLLIAPRPAFWVGLVFAVHPVHWEAVCNISGRAILLSSFFVLISAIAFIRGFRWPALFAYAAALLCKESAAVLPGFLGIYSLAYRKDLRWVPSWGVVIGGYLAIRWALDINVFFPWRNPTEYILGVMTFLGSLLTHLRVLVLPFDLHFDRSMKIYENFYDARLWAVVLAWAAIAAGLVFVRKRLSPLVWVCLAWFALDFLPVAQIVTTIGVQPGWISTAEHFLYMASVPAFILGALGAESLLGVLARQGRTAEAAGRAVLVILVAVFVLLASRQAYTAQDEERMIRRSLEISPSNARLQSSLGMIHVSRGQYALAQEHFQKAVEGEPLNPRYRVSLAQSLCDQGRWAACLAQFMSISDPGTHRQMMEKGSANAFARLEEELSTREAKAEDWLAIGHYHAKSARAQHALEAYGRALELDPANPQALFNTASIHEAMQDIPRAREFFERLIAADPSEEWMSRYAQTRLKLYVEFHQEQR